ncbi:hypothetical protein CI610_02115 [invertebrate metagenome]|uniref:YicC family protein n=1 Tax=invertebrate metagenome TaxID=1711999 RepID=A0A2H9T6U7_9ZZZZ
MTCSMTAFARSQIQAEWGSLVWEIRSVNHRYLEPHLRLPEQMREIEPAVRDILRKNIHRGKIECFLKLQPAKEQQATIVDKSAIERLLQAIEQAESVVSHTTTISPMDILRWPGVLQSQELDAQVINTAAVDAFQQAVEKLVQMRQREGSELEKVIGKKLDKVSEEVRAARQLMPELLAAQRKKLLDRFEEARVELNEERLEQEMVLAAQKQDVAEEMDRLDTHVSEVRHTFEQNSPIGRRLDFLMQEMNREANTLASKSLDFRLTQYAVSLKVLIEQMREQIQNIQ